MIESYFLKSDPRFKLYVKHKLFFVMFTDGVAARTKYNDTEFNVMFYTVSKNIYSGFFSDDANKRQEANDSITRYVERRTIEDHKDRIAFQKISSGAVTGQQMSGPTTGGTGSPGISFTGAVNWITHGYTHPVPKANEQFKQEYEQNFSNTPKDSYFSKIKKYFKKPVDKEDNL